MRCGGREGAAGDAHQIQGTCPVYTRACFGWHTHAAVPPPTSRSAPAPLTQHAASAAGPPPRGASVSKSAHSLHHPWRLPQAPPTTPPPSSRTVRWAHRNVQRAVPVAAARHFHEVHDHRPQHLIRGQGRHAETVGDARRAGQEAAAGAGEATIICLGAAEAGSDGVGGQGGGERAEHALAGECGERGREARHPPARRAEGGAWASGGCTASGAAPACPTHGMLKRGPA